MRKRGTVCMFEQARLEYFGKAERGALVTTVQKQLRAYTRKKERGKPMQTKPLGRQEAKRLVETLRLAPTTCHWVCETSPLKICVYHPPSDPGWFDRCVFCGLPMERK